MKLSQSVVPPTEFQYDQVGGYWISDNGVLLMNDKRSLSVGSKKFDVETGEDHKGK